VNRQDDSEQNGNDGNVTGELAQGTAVRQAVSVCAVQPTAACERDGNMMKERKGKRKGKGKEKERERKRKRRKEK
jgi:hypothetical protein